MAKDNSLIIVPPISSVSAVQKIDPTAAGQEVVFNNGIFINKSSLSAILPKSLYKVWKKNNKLYIFERETTNIENVFNFMASSIVSFRAQQTGTENPYVDFVDNTGKYVATKYTNSFYMFHEYQDFNNDTEGSSNKSLRTINPYTKFSTLSNSELYIDKALNIYNLKQNIITNYLQFVKLPQVINTNLFLRLKSLFTNKEITANYYNYFVYLYCNWGLFGLDDLITADFDVDKKIPSIKGKLSAPLKENDLILQNTIKIIDSKQKINNSTNVKLYQNVTVSDTTEKTNGTQTVTILDQDGIFIIKNDNGDLFTNKIFVFKNKLNNEITAIKPNNFYNINYTLNGANKQVKTSFTYNNEFVFNSTGPSLITKEWSNSAASRIRDVTFYDLYVYDETQYLGFHFYDSAVLELQIETTSFRTNSEGDFYVVEIV